MEHHGPRHHVGGRHQLPVVPHHDGSGLRVHPQPQREPVLRRQQPGTLRQGDVHQGQNSFTGTRIHVRARQRQPLVCHRRGGQRRPAGRARCPYGSGQARRFGDHHLHVRYHGYAQGGHAQPQQHHPDRDEEHPADPRSADKFGLPGVELLAGVPHFRAHAALPVHVHRCQHLLRRKPRDNQGGFGLQPTHGLHGRSAFAGEILRRHRPERACSRWRQSGHLQLGRGPRIAMGARRSERRLLRMEIGHRTQIGLQQGQDRPRPRQHPSSGVWFSRVGPSPRALLLRGGHSYLRRIRPDGDQPCSDRQLRR